MSNQDTALSLARAGFAIFPCGQDKKPLIPAWRENSTTNEAIIQQWWLSQRGSLPAIDCGKSNLVVIDCDRHKDQPDGVKAFKALCKKHNQSFDNLLIVKTPSGGRHIYFRQPNNGKPFTNSRGDLPSGIDCRGSGGYVIGIGAELANGKKYESSKSVADIKTELPAWCAEILQPVEKPAPAPKIDHKASSEREQAYADAACDNIANELAACSPGGRNEQLNKSAFRLGTMCVRGWIDRNKIETKLTEAADACGLVKDDGERAARATLKSGLDSGVQVPHPDLEEREQKGTGKTEASGDNYNWDDPDISILDDRRGDLPEFPTEVFAPACREWLVQAAHGAGVTAAHVAVPLIGIASALIGTARRVQAARSWTQPCTLWAAIVGFSGSGKTPGLDTVKRALAMIERTQKAKIADMQHEHEAKVEAAKAARALWKKQVEEAASGAVVKLDEYRTTKKAAPALPPEAIIPDPFVAPRLYVSDATIERLAVLLTVRPRGMLHIGDELAGLFLNMSRYSSGSDREFWLEAWNGGSFTVERMSREPIMVDHLLVGLVGGFQPDKLARSFHGDHDGLYGRVLFAWPSEPPYRALVNDVAEVEPEIVNALTRVINLEAGADQNGEFAPKAVPLAPDAVLAFEAFRQLVHHMKQAMDGREREWLAKAQAHALRLAGTLEFLGWAFAGGDEPKQIGLQSIEAATRLTLDYFWPHSRASLRQIGLSEKHVNARRVLKWLKANRSAEVSVMDIRRDALAQALDAEATEKLLDGLTKAGWLRRKPLEPTGSAGRKAHRWSVNPALY
jgi:hypothetical protein